VKSPNRVYDRLQILDLVWGQDTHVEPRTVDVHVRRLRQRIERDDADPELLLTVACFDQTTEPGGPSGIDAPRAMSPVSRGV
jgi:hypothetical protein